MRKPWDPLGKGKPSEFDPIGTPPELSKPFNDPILDKKNDPIMPPLELPKPFNDPIFDKKNDPIMPPLELPKQFYDPIYDKKFDPIVPPLEFPKPFNDPILDKKNEPIMPPLELSKPFNDPIFDKKLGPIMPPPELIKPFNEPLFSKEKPFDLGLNKPPPEPPKSSFDSIRERKNTCPFCFRYIEDRRMCIACLAEELAKHLRNPDDRLRLLNNLPFVPMLDVEALPSPLIIPPGEEQIFGLRIVNRSSTEIENVQIEIESDDKESIDITINNKLRLLRSQSEARIDVKIACCREGRKKLRLEWTGGNEETKNGIFLQFIDMVVTNDMKTLLSEIASIVDSVMKELWGLERPLQELIVGDYEDIQPSIRKALGGRKHLLPDNVLSPICTPKHVIIPLLISEDQDFAETLAYFVRAYVHEMYGHAPFYLGTPFGKSMGKLWSSANSLKGSDDLFLLAKDSCIATMEGFAVWLFASSLQNLCLRMPHLKTELEHQWHSCTYQLELFEDKTGRVEKSPVFVEKPWKFNFNSTVKPIRRNLYFYGWHWFSTIARRFGPECVLTALQQCMGFKVKSATKKKKKEPPIPIKGRPDYRLYQLSFAKTGDDDLGDHSIGTPFNNPAKFREFCKSLFD